MGLLTKGERLLSWAETKENADIVRRIGIQQFISSYLRGKDRKEYPYKWGDELEFCLATLNAEDQRAQLSLLGTTILPGVQEDKEYPASWTPEYARYMIEGTPDKPYGDSLSEVLKVEENMRLRWAQLRQALKGTETFPLTLSVFPTLGCHKFTSPDYKPSPESSVMKSHFFPDEVVVQPEEHPRYMALTSSIHERRLDRHIINVPIYRDTNTPKPFKEDLPADIADLALPDHVFMDCLAFGPGCSCMQENGAWDHLVLSVAKQLWPSKLAGMCSCQGVTSQLPDLDQGRYLFDQMIVLGPLFQAMTAGSPIFRGYLADVDCRWDVIAAAVDDRTPGERGLEPPKENERFIPKSRWSTAECFLATNAYNDIYVPNDPAVLQQLKDAGVDDLMAKHIAYLFLRDPLLLYGSRIQQDPEKDNDHLENFLSSNWHSMRFKSPNDEINAGWRVEVRTMDHQLTYRENAAFANFVMLLTRMILAFKPSLYIPMSKVEENMATVQKRDALHKEKFYFTKTLFPVEKASLAPSAHYRECELMDADTIFNGKGEFPGLIPLVRKYVGTVPGTDDATKTYIDKLLNFVSMKASGKLLTTAMWIRQFVMSHPDYSHDSCVSDKITYDLISKIKQISEGIVKCPELAGDLTL